MLFERMARGILLQRNIRVRRVADKQHLATSVQVELPLAAKVLRSRNDPACSKDIKSVQFS